MYASRYQRRAVCAIAACLAVWVMASVISVSGQTATPRDRADRRPVPPARAAVRPAAASVESQRALLDRYCVTCHSDRVKTANLSLQGLDLSKVADHAELWEKVIRKMRAGVMPPPDMPRPPLPEYEGLRDWLEGEIDRVALTKPNPGLGRPAPVESHRVRQCRS